MTDMVALVLKFSEKWGPMDGRPEFMKQFTEELYTLLQDAMASDGQAVFARRGVHGLGGPGFEEAVVETREKLLATIRLHETDGKPCWDERVNVVAFLAHSVRLGPIQLTAVLARMREFEYGHKQAEGGERGGQDPRDHR